MIVVCLSIMLLFSFAPVFLRPVEAQEEEQFKLVITSVTFGRMDDSTFVPKDPTITPSLPDGLARFALKIVIDRRDSRPEAVLPKLDFIFASEAPFIKECSMEPVVFEGTVAIARFRVKVDPEASYPSSFALKVVLKIVSPEQKVMDSKTVQIAVQPPRYEDTISITSISPIEGTEFSPGQEVTFKASIRYKLVSKSTGKIYLQAFDQKDSVNVELGSGTVQLEVSCKVPIKTSLIEETSTVYVVAFLLPEGVSSPEVYDTKEFVVRNIHPLVAVASKPITALYPDGRSETIAPNQNFDITPGTKVTLKDDTTLVTPVGIISVNNGDAEIEYKNVPVLRAITPEEKEKSEIFWRRVKIIKQKMENVPVDVKTFDFFLPVPVAEPLRHVALKIEEKKLWGWKETIWEDEASLFYKELAGWYWDHKYDLAKGYIVGKVLGHFKTIKKLPSYLQNFISNVLADEEIRKRFVESLPDGLPGDTAFSSFGHRSSLVTPAGMVIHQTNFMFEVLEDGTTTLAVIEGEAEFMDINQTKIVTVSAGQSSTIKPGSAPSSPSPFADDDGDGYPDALELWETIEIGITLSEHTLCLGVDSEGNPIEVKTVFTDDEKVVSWLSVVNASEGDEIRWFFKGPNEIMKEIPYTLEWDGEGYCYAMLDLNNYDSVGDWTVTVYVNGEDVLTQQFTVEERAEEESLLNILLGFLILIAPIIIVAAVIRHLIKRRGKK